MFSVFDSLLLTNEARISDDNGNWFNCAAILGGTVTGGLGDDSLLVTIIR